jgi:hypothetical protein
VALVASNQIFLYFNFAIFSIAGIVTDKTFLSGNSSCHDLNANADAVLQANITILAQLSNKKCNHL